MFNNNFIEKVKQAIKKPKRVTITDEHGVRSYLCKQCQSVLFRYGSFKKDCPDFKEVRYYGVYDPRKVKMWQLYHHTHPKRPIGLMIEGKCDKCGVVNKHAVIFRPDQYRLNFKYN